MKCHALGCQEQALVGMPPCYDHWLLWPAKVRARTPWVTRPAPVPAADPVKPHKVHSDERGQMALFS